jgi:GNAT superfamily N-acetyltransferase
MTPFSIEELVIPAGIDDPDAADFIAAVDLRNAIEAEKYGTRDLALGADELLPGWHDPEHSPRRLFGVRVDGRLAARAYYERSVGEGASVAWVTAEVLPPFRGRGIGTLLADRVEGLASHDARDRVLVYCASPDGPGERLPSPTGFGSVPLGNPEVRFLLGRGYTLEQVERGSRLALPFDDATLTEALAEASRSSSDAYRLHSWTDTTPADRLADIAHLYTRMSTDAPSAGLDEPEDTWTAERVSSDEQRELASPRSTLVTAVEHVGSGRLVGYTSLAVPRETSRSVGQEDTLVLREHRGHRLGMLLKLANLRYLQAERPGHPSITTFNAEENRPMLDVNEALGFVPMGYEGAWKKEL